jgi:cysteinyl-tRNA synthetase
VNISGEKMSKSLGNFTTIRQMLESGFDPMVLRLFVLQAQYRKPIDFTEEAIASAQNAWDTLTEGLRFGYRHGAALGFGQGEATALNALPAPPIATASESVQRFQAAMDDDLNTPVALSVLFELAKELQKEGNRLTHDGKTLAEPAALQAQWQTLVALAEVLGLTVSPDAAPAPDGLSDAEIEALVQQRAAAKQAKNWAEGDRIRDELKAQGITLIDKPGGVTEWIRGS